ncbi:DNA cytosine methyltransferase [Bradyrhizobium sp.]
MPSSFAIVDLFAGPGGLAEGFSSIRTQGGGRPFFVALSVEKEASAYKTLLMRSFLRQFENGFPPEYYHFLNGDTDEPNWITSFPEEWNAALKETLNLELGSKDAAAEIDRRIDQIKKTHNGNTLLIGGPPCQAYSLVGRARNRGIAGYKASADPRHFLYKEYIRILDRLRPAVFVMENVKGMLSSSVGGEGVFDLVLKDLAAVGRGAYTLVPLSPRSNSSPQRKALQRPSSDFVVRSEELGLPQARHRVIIVGIRKDITDQFNENYFIKGLLRKSSTRVTVRNVLLGLPKLRSGVSGMEDSADTWRTEVVKKICVIAKLSPDMSKEQLRAFRRYAQSAAKKLGHGRKKLGRIGAARSQLPATCPSALRDWLSDAKIRKVPNNETRGHMPSDLGRYFFSALYGKVTGTSPKAGDYPRALAPDHRNWGSGKFADRFRVQLWNEPATTITSHISKDGHYFIHPDPFQCRSLTVREAARLQTFPDNYLFKGNRTEQYVQVGNAVPPFLARKIAAALHKVLEQASIRANNAKVRKNKK